MSATWKGLLIILFISNLDSIKSQSVCSSNDNCGGNEFCDVNSSNCISCVDCGIYNRVSKQIACAQEVLEDCGNCLEGYEAQAENVCSPIPETPFRDLEASGLNETFEDSISSDQNFTGLLSNESLVDEEDPISEQNYTGLLSNESLVDEEILLSANHNPTDANDISFSETTRSTMMAKTTISTTRKETHVLYGFGGGDPIRKVGVQSSQSLLQTELTTTESVDNSSLPAKPVYEGDRNKPWIFVGLSFTLFILFGTAGVVGFKYYLLPIQLQEKRLQREGLLKEQAKNAKKDLNSASKEERERLYYDKLDSSNNYIGINYTKIYGKNPFESKNC